MNHIEAATLRQTLYQVEVDDNDPEVQLLGSLLMNPAGLTGAYGQPALIGYLFPDDFKELQNAWIYQAMLNLSARNIEPNLDTIADELLMSKAEGGELPEYNQLVAMKGKNYLYELANAISAPIMGITADGFNFFTVNLWEAYYSYAYLIVERAAERKTRALLGKAVTANRDHDIGKVEQLQLEIDHQIHRNSHDGQGLVVEDDGQLAQVIETWYDDPQPIRGYRTGIEELDYRLGGLQENELMILAGYTGSGKSTMVMQFALSFCDQGAGLIVPTEMSVSQWKLRMIAYLLGTDDKTIREGQYRDKARLMEAANYVTKDLPITWFKGAAPTPTQILTSARNLRRNNLIDWVVVDGLHDIKAEGEIYERTNAAIDGLHEMAALGLRVVATAHLNRGATAEPNIRDLLGSSRIEQVATRILTLYRPGNLMESGELKSLPNGVSPNMAQVRLAKSRFSEAGKVVRLMFGKQNDGPHGFSKVTEPERVNLVNYKED